MWYRLLKSPRSIKARVGSNPAASASRNGDFCVLTVTLKHLHLQEEI